ncbi:MAG: DNA repair protein RecN [Rickettsiales bacterium]|jgi:DNA repair protein RecN (Recombination protein N)|nr:DNA repair protein RecN [Rickettsiales bacterium]
MLNSLHISNIVLIDKLNLEFGGGLTVMTGETGAGKSIMLDALALALGARGDAGLIRHGAESASVAAEFCMPADKSILVENGIDADTDAVILRRTLGADGKSRAFVNDTPVSLKVLKAVGDELAEIHGQFQNHSLLDSATHCGALDEFGGYDLIRIKNTYGELHRAEKQLRELREIIARAGAEREFLEHNVAELKKLNPATGEEEELSAARGAMMNAEKNASVLDEASQTLHGLDEKLFAAAHILQRIKSDDANPYQPQIDKLYDLGAAVGEVSAATLPAQTDAQNLESVEERLFALRAAARKHRCSCDELAQKFSELNERLNAIENSDAQLKTAEADFSAAKKNYAAAAARLHDARVAAAEKLRAAILAELPDLKLGAADFMIEITESAPGPRGSDGVVFMIKTNPGTPFAPLHKTASGGELARLMLALRVVLARGDQTMIFDEIDTGISGATAAAVGMRLNRLGMRGQLLVITHSAQVAGFGDHHFKIEKIVDGAATTTHVREIRSDERLGEIARIISGAEITAQSLATAKTLIKETGI